MVTADPDGSDITQKLPGAAADGGMTWGEGEDRTAEGQDSSMQLC